MMQQTVRRAAMLWSGGKDSMMAFDAALDDPSLSVETLVTTVTKDYDRVSMHGVRRKLIEAQAAALGMPIVISEIPAKCTNAEYEAALAATMRPIRESGLTHVIAGDLFLADIREYRERQFGELGLTTLFPVWGVDTQIAAHTFIARGGISTVCCVDPRRVDASVAGRRYDLSLLADLPPEADPCGENGEFHTFVSDGPRFRRPLEITVGEIVEREGFVFADLALA